MSRKSLSIFIILAVGAVLAVMILQTEPPGTVGPHSHDEPAGHTEEGDHSEADETAAEERAEDKGPHRGRLFSRDNLKLEVAIYERNVPPQFRVYATDASGNNIPLDQI